MKFQQPHELTREEARARIQKLLDYWHTHHGVGVDWSGDSARVHGKVKGFNFDATLAVREHAVDAEGTDPGFLLRAAATAYLKRKLADYLDPSKAIDQVGKHA